MLKAEESHQIKGPFCAGVEKFPVLAARLTIPIVRRTDINSGLPLINGPDLLWWHRAGRKGIGMLECRSTTPIWELHGRRLPGIRGTTAPIFRETSADASSKHIEPSEGTATTMHLSFQRGQASPLCRKVKQLP